VEQHKIGWDAALDELEQCFDQAQVIPTESTDPFREYLQTLYQAIVDDLDRRVIKQIDLRSKIREGAVIGCQQTEARSTSRSSGAG
jgi:hypothetical protein